MFRTFLRTFFPNPFDWRLRRAAKKKVKSVLVCWNRGLGDIPLGLYAIVHRIRTYLPEAKITFLVRSNLVQGMSMLEGVETIVAPQWKRGEPFDLTRTLEDLQLNRKNFDLIFERPLPSEWCRWQYGTLHPKLCWDVKHDSLWEKFNLADGFTYIGVQVSAETHYGFWRNWSLARWEELFDLLAGMGKVRVLLFGYGEEVAFSHPMVIDLRGKTTLFELLSIVKHRCSMMVLPDSGILSMIYYLKSSFPIKLVTLWGDPRHGILKQKSPSPNRLLVHVPLIGALRDLSSVTAEQVFDALFPSKKWTPLRICSQAKEEASIERTAALILAGGQGSRLGFHGPKGLFPLLDKTLFEYQIQKVLPEMPVAIMTSPLNREETERYFAKHHNFGRKVQFFSQELVPLLDEHYREVGMGPDGNGGVYRHLVASQIWQQWMQEKIETVILVPIENPLADPADKKLFFHHTKTKADVTIKCVERKKGESMGMLVEEKGRLGVAEYGHFPPQVSPSAYSYVGQLALSLSFIEKASHLSLPFHWVKKKIVAYGQEIVVWKREQFLFDAFHIAEKVEALCYPRHVCYAPIKTAAHIAEVEEMLKR